MKDTIHGIGAVLILAAGFLLLLSTVGLNGVSLFINNMNSRGALMFSALIVFIIGLMFLTYN